MGSLTHYLRGLIGSPSGQTDRELLRAFATRHDEASFTAIMQRHGPLVWGVCRRLLREQDAEDAFQATFFVLAKKADSVEWADDVGNWLYAVALRVAQRVRIREMKRSSGNDIDLSTISETDAQSDLDTAAIVAEEVGRLPEKYRRPMILCALEGKSYTEAAKLLGWPEGTVSGRLARGRELLRRRLERRGLGPAAATPPLPMAITPPAPLVQATSPNASTFATNPGLATPAALAQEVIRSMLVSKLKVAAIVVLTLTILVAGLFPPALQRETPAAPAPLPRVERRSPEEAAWTSPTIRSLGKMGPYHKVAAISPNGEEILITESFIATVYNLSEGKAVRSFTTKETIQNASISPDGKLLATAEWRDGAKIRDYRTLEVLYMIKNSEGLGAHQIGFSRDGARLHGYNWWGQKLQLWTHDLATKKTHEWPSYTQPDTQTTMIREWFMGQPPLLFSIERQREAGAGLYNGYRMWLTDPETNEKTKPLTLGKRDYFQFAVNTGGTRAVIMEPGEAPRLVDLHSGKDIRVLAGHERWLSAAAFSPSGQLLATATGTSDDGHALVYTKKWPPRNAPTEIIVRHTATGRVLAKWDTGKQRHDFYRIGFSPNGRMLYAVTYDHELWIWGKLPVMPEKLEPIPVKYKKQ